MTDLPPRGNAPFEDTLAAMTAIAEVVSKFASEQLQRSVFDICAAAYGIPQPPPARTETPEPILSVVPTPSGDAPEERGTEESGLPAPSNSPASAKRRSSKKKSSARHVDINFRPDGKPSLVDFVAEKAPGSVAEKSTLAIYYVAEILGESAVEAGHVLAAFSECNWPYPSPTIEAALQVNACKKHYFDTSDMKNITLTNAGRNLVKILMPTRTKKPA
jgi:hypothetical protein